jgi:hypothetical protein
MKQITLIQGDAHTGNILFSRDETNHAVVLINWQLWEINVGAIDLAFLMADHWSPQNRGVL